MGTYILTSMFHNGFHEQAAEVFQKKITKRERFVLIASDFENLYEKTEKYFYIFLNMFEKIGINFEKTCIIDGRMNIDEAKKAISEADVVWLSGGNTPVQFEHLKKYGLVQALIEFNGVMIGMSAGSINMAKTSICTLSCGHYNQEIYDGLACVDVSVEPHFVRNEVSNEVLELSKKHIIYGLCDDSFIICSGKAIEFYGEIYKLNNGIIERL